MVISAAILLKNSVCRPLRILPGGEGHGKIASDSISSKEECVSPRDRKHSSLKARQLRTDDASSQKKRLPHIAFLRIGAHQHSLDVPNTEPGHHAMFRVNASKAQYNPASCPELLVASFHERDNWFAVRASQKRGGYLRGIGSFFAVPYAVNRCNQNSVSVAANQVVIARLSLTRKSELGNTIFDHRLSYCLHFFTATTVPRPGWEVISNSSIKRRTPGNPSPRLPEVEKPSRNAWRTSGIPGPSSVAMTEMP